MTRGFRVAIEERYYFKKDAPYGPYFALELDIFKEEFLHQAMVFKSEDESSFL